MARFNECKMMSISAITLMHIDHNHVAQVNGEVSDSSDCVKIESLKSKKAVTPQGAISRIPHSAFFCCRS